MDGIEGLEDRQRMDRWLAESQYLIGRLIPAYVDDRDRLRTRLDATEHDAERLRREIAEARRELAEVRAELEFLRAQRATVAESFTAIVEHLTTLQKATNDATRQLQTSAPTTPGEARVSS